MDCRDALEWLEAAEIGAVPSTEGELADARQHLASCPGCSSAWPRLQRWARTLSAAMPQVEVPHGLRARLLADVPVVSAPAEPVKPSSRRRVRRWGLAGLSTVLAALLVVVAVTTWWQPIPPVPLEDLITATTADMNELPLFRGAFEPRLPDSWTSTFTLDPSIVRRYPAAGDAANSAAVVSFAYTIRSGQEPLRGRLVMIPWKRFSLDGATTGRSELPSRFTSAQAYYLRTGTAYVVWREDDLVFVCLMPSGPADLERFQRALSGSRSFT